MGDKGETTILVPHHQNTLSDISETDNEQIKLKKVIFKILFLYFN